ncbi:cytochrome P450 [Artomyces pyxidatus]|uniref:Cytochrome P450 n=1 Tax=Artomyces pyxidatus TaxID=48021 RepID=A0ACB8SUG3_9AGAM|nr:cytochrome P450 [Artomyces pyxidatus]
MFDPITGIDFREHSWKAYGRVSRFSGPLGDQILLISDPKVLASILVKNSDIFEEHDWFIELFRHAVGPGLFSSLGAIHRRQRKALNPIFSIPHMRSVVPIFHKITDELLDALQAQVTDGPQEIEMMDWFGRAALEMISQSGLGHTFESFKPNADRNDFKDALKEFMPAAARLYIVLLIFPLVSKWPSKLLRLGAAFIPLPDVAYIVKLTDAMHVSVKDLFQTKQALLEEGEIQLANQIGGGKDIISMLMKSNINAADEFRMQDEEVMAQMLTLMGAGTETTSNALARIVQLLSEHDDVQENLRQELNGASPSSGGELGYDELMELPYLDAICRETMRVYVRVPSSPPRTPKSMAMWLIFLIDTLPQHSPLESRTDSIISLSRPIRGDPTSDASLFVPRNTSVVVDILGVNCDPDIWGADARAWKPERWLAPLPDSVAKARIPGIYSDMLTFSGGSRSCIGFKLAEIEMKVVVSRLVKSFRLLPPRTEVVWRLGHVSTPSIKGSNGITPTMPIVLESI